MTTGLGIRHMCPHNSDISKAGTSARAPAELHFTQLQALLSLRLIVSPGFPSFFDLFRGVSLRRQRSVSNTWLLILQPNRTSMGLKCRSSCAGSTMHRVLAAATVREWWPCLTEVNMSKDQYEVRVFGRVEQNSFRAEILHPTCQ